MCHIEQELDTRLDFVDVLPTRPTAPRELEMQLRPWNGHVIIDDDTIRHGFLRYEIIAAVSFSPAPQFDGWNSRPTGNVQLHFHRSFITL